MIRYDEHALFQMERRGIKREWVEQALGEPDEIVESEEYFRLSYFKCLEGRRNMLRVVVPKNDPEYVISAYFDRRKPCA